jgi:four helix bundle protein
MAAFQRLQAWQACLDLTTDVYHASAGWPRAEEFGLTAQVRRAVVSAGANLAEGSGKQGASDFARYLDIANGSLTELEHLLLVGHQVGIIEPADWERLEGKRAKAARLTRRLHQAVRARATSNRPAPR